MDAFRLYLEIAWGLESEVRSARQGRWVPELHFHKGLFTDAQRTGGVVQIQLDKDDHGRNHENQHGNQRVSEVLHGPNQDLKLNSEEDPQIVFEEAESDQLRAEPIASFLNGGLI